MAGNTQNPEELLNLFRFDELKQTISENDDKADSSLILSQICDIFLLGASLQDAKSKPASSNSLAMQAMSCFVSGDYATALLRLRNLEEWTILDAYVYVICCASIYGPLSFDFAVRVFAKSANPAIGCLLTAQVALQSGNFENAVKSSQKSQDLFTEAHSSYGAALAYHVQLKAMLYNYTLDANVLLYNVEKLLSLSSNALNIAPDLGLQILEGKSVSKHRVFVDTALTAAEMILYSRSSSVRKSARNILKSLNDDITEYLPNNPLKIRFNLLKMQLDCILGNVTEEVFAQAKLENSTHTDIVSVDSLIRLQLLCEFSLRLLRLDDFEFFMQRARKMERLLWKNDNSWFVVRHYLFQAFFECECCNFADTEKCLRKAATIVFEIRPFEQQFEYRKNSRSSLSLSSSESSLSSLSYSPPFPPLVEFSFIHACTLSGMFRFEEAVAALQVDCSGLNHLVFSVADTTAVQFRMKYKLASLLVHMGILQEFNGMKVDSILETCDLEVESHSVLDRIRYYEVKAEYMRKKSQFNVAYSILSEALKLAEKTCTSLVLPSTSLLIQLQIDLGQFSQALEVVAQSFEGPTRMNNWAARIKLNLLLADILINCPPVQLVSQLSGRLGFTCPSGGFTTGSQLYTLASECIKFVIRSLGMEENKITPIEKEPNWDEEEMAEMTGPEDEDELQDQSNSDKRFANYYSTVAHLLQARLFLEIGEPIQALPSIDKAFAIAQNLFMRDLDLLFLINVTFARFYIETCKYKQAEEKLVNLSHLSLGDRKLYLCTFLMVESTLRSIQQNKVRLSEIGENLISEVLNLVAMEDGGLKPSKTHPIIVNSILMDYCNPVRLEAIKSMKEELKSTLGNDGLNSSLYASICYIYTRELFAAGSKPAVVSPAIEETLKCHSLLYKESSKHNAIAKRLEVSIRITEGRVNRSLTAHQCASILQSLQSIKEVFIQQDDARQLAHTYAVQANFVAEFSDNHAHVKEVCLLGMKCIREVFGDYYYPLLAELHAQLILVEPTLQVKSSVGLIKDETDDAAVRVNRRIALVSALVNRERIGAFELAEALLAETIDTVNSCDDHTKADFHYYYGKTILSKYNFRPEDTTTLAQEEQMLINAEWHFGKVVELLQQKEPRAPHYHRSLQYATDICRRIIRTTKTPEISEKYCNIRIQLSQSLVEVNEILLKEERTAISVARLVKSLQQQYECCEDLLELANTTKENRKRWKALKKDITQWLKTLSPGSDLIHADSREVLSKPKINVDTVGTDEDSLLPLSPRKR